MLVNSEILVDFRFVVDFAIISHSRVHNLCLRVYARFDM